MNKEPSEDHNFLAHVCYFLSPWHNPKIIGESKDKLIMEFWILGSLTDALLFHNLSILFKLLIVKLACPNCNYLFKEFGGLLVLTSN